MNRQGDMDYASARVHARHGMRPRETEWRRLEASRDLRQCLADARASSLAEWTASLSPTCDCHTIERVLRTEWRRYVANVSAWHPTELQAWLTWCAWLPTLSLLTELTRAAPAPLWLLADPVCGPLALGSPAERAAALEKTALAPLAPALVNSAPIGALWRAHWQTLLPPLDPQTHDLLNRMLAAIDAHAGELTRGSASTPTLRRNLGTQLAHVFRAGAGTIVATACHLAILALDLERLRGDLVSRCALPAQTAEVAS